MFKKIALKKLKFSTFNISHFFSKYLKYLDFFLKFQNKKYTLKLLKIKPILSNKNKGLSRKLSSRV